MKKITIFGLATAMVMLVSNEMKADIPLSYYSTLDGKCGQELKTAIHNLVSNNVKMLSYGSGNNATWWGFYVTDYVMNNSKREVVDRYSNDVRYFGSRGSSVSGMNIEHSFPKSWWGGSSNNAYKDLYNLMPSEKNINTSKSNYGMGVVTNVKTDNGCTKVGTGANGVSLWEPADKWKGDFARGYLYMATAYQDFTWTGEGLKSLQTGAWPTLQKWAYTLYIQWAKADPVNQQEIDRNDAVAAIQGNRNPYIDFPNLMDYVWGDSISTPLNLLTTVKAGQTNGSPDDPVVTDVVIYEQNFTTGNGQFTASGTPSIWVITTQYGWKGSGYIGGACKAADASIESPELDLTKYINAEMEFSHAANQFKGPKPEEYCSVGISVDGAAPDYLTGGITWPAGTNWTFVSSGKVNLSRFCGHKVRVVFRYTSDEQYAGTWEIKNLKVTAKGSSGIEELSPDFDTDENAPVEYYSIDGRRLDESNIHGLVIKRQGKRVTKMIVR